MYARKESARARPNAGGYRVPVLVAAVVVTACVTTSCTNLAATTTAPLASTTTAAPPTTPTAVCGPEQHRHPEQLMVRTRPIPNPKDTVEEKLSGFHDDFGYIVPVRNVTDWSVTLSMTYGSCRTGGSTSLRR